MRNIKTYWLSFLFLFLFIAPNTLYIFLSSTLTKVLLFTLLGCYILFFLINVKEIVRNIYVYPLALTLVFILFGTLNLVIKGSTETFNVLGPIIAYIAYFFANRRKLDSNMIGIFLIGLWVYYFFVYYITLPDLFVHPELEDFFGKASSNAIPITINITLYAYMILNKYLDQNNKGKIVTCAFINVLLIIIQQSRAGIIISILILFVASYDYSKKMAAYMMGLFGLFAVYLVAFHLQDIIAYIEIVGNMDLNSLKEDIRGDAQTQFFDSMDLKAAFFGYGIDGDFAGLKYTYNVFLDVWSRYGILPLIVLLLTFLYRIIFFSRYKFPLYYFVPFLVYSLVESQFFPNFWDVIVYLMLFIPKELNHSHFTLRTNKTYEA